MGRQFESVRDYYRGNMTDIKIGSVWMKKLGEWGSEAGQLIIVESVESKEPASPLTSFRCMVHYRYANEPVHGPASWPTDVFLKRMELIKDV